MLLRTFIILKISFIIIFCDFCGKIPLSFRMEFCEAICNEESIKNVVILDFSTPLRCAQNDSSIN